MASARGPSARRPIGPTLQSETAHQVRNRTERLHRCRERHALELAGQQHEPFQRGDEVRASLGCRHRMDLIQDHGGQAAQHRPAVWRGQEQVEALWRGDQDLRRLSKHAPAVRGERIAASGLHANGRKLLPCELEGLGDLLQRRQQVSLDVIVERLQRRDVEDPNRVRPPGAADELVDAPQERGEGLARAGGSRHQHVGTARNLGPGARLDVGRLSEGAQEPLRDDGVEKGERSQVLVSHPWFQCRSTPRARVNGGRSPWPLALSAPPGQPAEASLPAGADAIARWSVPSPSLNCPIRRCNSCAIPERCSVAEDISSAADAAL